MTLNRVGKAYASKRSAQAYAEREWLGEHVAVRIEQRARDMKLMVESVRDDIDAL